MLLTTKVRAFCFHQDYNSSVRDVKFTFDVENEQILVLSGKPFLSRIASLRGEKKWRNEFKDAHLSKTHYACPQMLNNIKKIRA